MKRLILLFSVVAILVIGCGAPPVSVGDLQLTAEARSTEIAEQQQEAESGFLDTVRAVAPSGAVIADIAPGRAHDDSIRYEFDGLPPNGGTHSPTWQRCGIYDNPVRPENVIHSMEHGAVWISYQDSLSSGDISTLERTANSVESVVLAPYPNLPSAVVVTAWGVQLAVDSADDPRIQEFINEFARGPQTPEPEANCASGITTMDG